MDKKSRYLSINILKGKYEAIEAFRKFKNIIENQNNIKIKEFFSNNRREYINNNFKILFNY